MAKGKVTFYFQSRLLVSAGLTHFFISLMNLAL